MGLFENKPVEGAFVEVLLDVNENNDGAVFVDEGFCELKRPPVVDDDPPNLMGVSGFHV